MNKKWPYSNSLDALKAAPKSHKLILENDKVRIIEVVIEPGLREPQHTHKWPSVMIVDKPTRIVYYDENNNATVISREDTVYHPIIEWMEPKNHILLRTSAQLPATQLG
jgi:quercetin dioxygenase-like cupin family protein